MVDYLALDPGIRDTVRRLRDAGFDTTDSGDGVSKPASWYESGEAMPFPHVVCSVDAASLQTEADRLCRLLGAEWVIEATYWPHSGSAVLLARAADERERAA